LKWKFEKGLGLEQVWGDTPHACWKYSQTSLKRRKQNTKAERKQMSVGIALFHFLDLCATENAVQVPLSVFILHSS